MYQVFIADDEKYVREGLKKHIPWEKLDLQIIGEADNGKDALNFLIRNHADILITDVKMPLMDGIELVQQLREKNIAIKIVFISGYDDFEYLRSALRLEAIDYIMKSIDLNLLEETLNRIVSTLDKEQEVQQSRKNEMTRLDKSIAYLRRRILLDIAQGKNVNDIEISVLQDLDLDAMADYFLFLLKLSGDTLKAAPHEIIAVAESILPQEHNGYIFDAGNDIIAVLIQACANNSSETESASIEMLKNRCIDTLHICLGIECEASPAIRFTGLDRMSSVFESLRTYSSKIGFAAKKKLFMPEVVELLAAVQEGSVEQMLKLLETSMEQIHKNNTPGDERYSLLSLLLLLSDIISEMSAVQGSRANIVLDLCNNFSQCQTIDDCRRIVINTYREVTQWSAEMNQKQKRAIVIRIKEIIDQGYCTQLSVSDIAKEVFLTPTYLSKLFKASTNQTIGEYITEKRIAKAKELLGNPTIKLYEIGFAIGYSTPSYFTRVFKKETGLSPQEYRNRNGSQEEPADEDQNAAH